MKIIKRISILIYIILFSFLMIKINVLATGESPIYYEEKILETNEISGGLTHKKITGFSQVTDPTTIDEGAKEAGLGSSTPLVLNKYYSQQLNVLEIPNDANVKIVPWANFGNGVWTLSKVTEMAENYESTNPGWKVVAAINGDFFDINGNYSLRYTPLGGMKVDNELYKVNTDWPQLGINNYNEGNKLNGFLAGEVAQSQNPYLYIYDENDNIIKEFEINRINSNPLDNEISLYIAYFDSNHNVIEQTVEDAYIVSNAYDTVAFSNRSAYGKGIISTYGNATIKNNQFAIKTSNQEVLSYLKENVKIKIEYKILNDTLNNCDSIIGYHDNILVNGVPCYENDGYGKARLPRTLLGTKEDGSIVMIVCDGRQPNKGFYGLSNQEVSAVAQHYGMVNGYQMDGGGSATMVILKDGEFQVVNSPSDSQGLTQRSDSNCILVAMHVPTIEYEVVKKYNSLEFKVNVIKELEEYKDLYIDLNGVKKQLGDGNIVFENLKSNTEYVYSFYALVEDQYISIAYQGKLISAKQLPVVESVYIYTDYENNLSRYRIEYITDDPDKAITYAVLKIEDKKYWVSEGKFYYSLDKDNLSNAKKWSIELNYNLVDDKGNIRVDINDCVIYFGNIEAALDAQLETITNNMLEIFTN